MENINYEEKINELVQELKKRAIVVNLKIVDPIAGEQEYYVEISFSDRTRKCIGLHPNKDIAIEQAYRKALAEFTSLSN